MHYMNKNNIVSVYDVGQDGDINYIVMELLETKTLKDYIQENPTLDLNQIIDVVNKDIDNNISKTKSKKRTKQNDK